MIGLGVAGAAVTTPSVGEAVVGRVLDGEADEGAGLLGAAEHPLSSERSWQSKTKSHRNAIKMHCPFRQVNSAALHGAGAAVASGVGWSVVGAREEGAKVQPASSDRSVQSNAVSQRYDAGMQLPSRH